MILLTTSLIVFGIKLLFYVWCYTVFLLHRYSGRHVLFDTHKAGSICLDLDMLVLYKMEEERRNINMETQGEAAERNVTIQTDCLNVERIQSSADQPNTSGSMMRNQIL